jgi:hypothetical protein
MLSSARIFTPILSQNDILAVALLIPSKHLPSRTANEMSLGLEDIRGLLLDSLKLRVYGNTIRQHGNAIWSVANAILQYFSIESSRISDNDLFTLRTVTVLSRSSCISSCFEQMNDAIIC